MDLKRSKINEILEKVSSEKDKRTFLADMVTFETATKINESLREETELFPETMIFQTHWNACDLCQSQLLDLILLEMVLSVLYSRKIENF